MLAIKMLKLAALIHKIGLTLGKSSADFFGRQQAVPWTILQIAYGGNATAAKPSRLGVFSSEAATSQRPTKFGEPASVRVRVRQPRAKRACAPPHRPQQTFTAMRRPPARQKRVSGRPPNPSAQLYQPKRVLRRNVAVRFVAKLGSDRATPRRAQAVLVVRAYPTHRAMALALDAVVCVRHRKPNVAPAVVASAPPSSPKPAAWASRAVAAAAEVGEWARIDAAQARLWVRAGVVNARLA